MKKVKGGIWMSLIALGILVLLGWTIWQNVRFFSDRCYNKNHIMNILGKNVWFAIKNDKGEIIDGMQPKTPRGDTPSYRANTPGYYAISSFLDYRDEYWDGSEITLEVEYPYGLMSVTARRGKPPFATVSRSICKRSSTASLKVL